MLEVTGNFPEPGLWCQVLLSRIHPCLFQLAFRFCTCSANSSRKKQQRRDWKIPWTSRRNNCRSDCGSRCSGWMSWGRLGSFGIPGIRRRILCSLCRSLHEVVAVQAGITLGIFSYLSPMKQISSCPANRRKSWRKWGRSVRRTRNSSGKMTLWNR